MIVQLGRFEARKAETEDGFFYVAFVPDRENSVSLVVLCGLSESNATDLADKLNAQVIDFRFEL